MTTTTVPTQIAPQEGLELLISRLAVSMLRWSQVRTARRHMTHDEMMLLRQTQKDSATAIDLARLSRLA
ncbi:MAG: hypothetical protein ABJA11_06475 [Pseudolysinimonas sp.]